MTKSQKAWLLTWEWVGDHAAVEDKVAAILRPRLSRKVVTEIVLYLYAINNYSPTELARWSRRPRENPYAPHWYNEHCVCGANPSLHANYVHKLRIEENPHTGLETISWVHPPSYRYNHATQEIEQVRGEYPRSVTRSVTGPLSACEIGR